MSEMTYQEAAEELRPLLAVAQQIAAENRHRANTCATTCARDEWSRAAEFRECKAAALRLAIKALEENAKREALSARLKHKPTQPEWHISGPSEGDQP